MNHRVCRTGARRAAKPTRKTAQASFASPGFLKLVTASGHSSFEYLQNVLVPHENACQGAAIALFYFEDRSIKEISAILDMPAGTVKYQLSMGRNHLKQHIQL